MVDATQVSIDDVALTGVPARKKSKGVVMAMVEEDNTNIYIDGQDSEIKEMFDKADLLRAAGNGSSSPLIDR